MRVLITGVAGFIGFHLAMRLVSEGAEVLGIDNINDYYDVTLKQARLQKLANKTNFAFEKIDLADSFSLKKIFTEHQFSMVFHLGAQAGVRYSIENPQAYIDSNIVGFMNILECCRAYPVEHLIYASSSSVYGLNKATPFSVENGTNHPVSLYAASKKSNELMAHSYSHLYDIPTTGLRFFTVYGPWGRPDMAPMLFAKAIVENKPIRVFNNGNMERDFTFIDDIVNGMIGISKRIPARNPDWDAISPSPSSSSAPYAVYNIGNGNPVPLMKFIKTLEDNLGIEAQKEFLEMQPGDVVKTWSDTLPLEQATGVKPATSIENGVKSFVNWYREYYQC